MPEADPAAAPAPAGAMAELELLLGFHISLANTAIKAHFQLHDAGLGLTQKQIAILWLLDGCPAIVQSELARRLGVKRATMWAMIGTLCTRGLLERRGHGNADARHVALKLTSEGREVLAAARGAIARHEEWVKQPFDAAEQRLLAELMARIYRRRP